MQRRQIRHGDRMFAGYRQLGVIATEQRSMQHPGIDIEVVALGAAFECTSQMLSELKKSWLSG